MKKLLIGLTILGSLAFAEDYNATPTQELAVYKTIQTITEGHDQKIDEIYDLAKIKTFQYDNGNFIIVYEEISGVTTIEAFTRFGYKNGSAKIVGKSYDEIVNEVSEDAIEITMNVEKL